MSRIATAGLIALAGAGSATLLPPPWGWVAFAIFASFGMLVLLRKPREVIMRFGKLSWTRDELCRHVLITGDTGCGKTTSGVQPILRQLTRNAPGWGGLVLGVKGDEHRFITELAAAHGREGDVVHLQVRPEDASTKWEPPHRYNLLSDRGLAWTTHAKIIVDVAASLTEGKSHAFFRPMAQLALANAFGALDELGHPVTIARAHRLLSSREEAKEAVKELKGKEESGRRKELAAFLAANFTEAKADEQREAVAGTVATYLGFLLHPDVAAVISSDKPNTFSLSDLDRGAILSITMPQSLATERRYVSTYFKILFYLHALRRFDLNTEERSKKNLLLLVADEFQDVVTASEDGFSDHKTLDRIRGARACVIAAMQSEISPDPTINELKRRVLALNMRTRLIFRAADSKGAQLAAEFIGKREIWKRSYSTGTRGVPTVTRRKEPEYFIRPEKLLRLRDHTAVIVHPSKRIRRVFIKPRTKGA